MEGRRNSMPVCIGFIRTLTRAIAMLGAGVSLVASAQALSPADRCEAEKLKRAGKYSFCRLKAESRAVKTGNAPDYAPCDLNFSGKWTTAETVAGGQCPTSGDLGSMQARITADANDVAACLDGTCPPSCGDAIANGAESCDGMDLAGTSCGSLGFDGGTLGCTAGCGFDVSGCVPPASSLPATGQTTSFGPGSDGDVQAGATLSYTDNGDGTITDDNTGLVWEKKSADGSVHDWNNQYSWCDDSSPLDGACDTPGNPLDGTIKTAFLDTLNDVAGGGVSCFAGHCDWRIPNSKELYSIVDLGVSVGGFLGPATLDATFGNASCVPGCTVLTCSCALPVFHWSSTTFLGPSGGTLAWMTDFGSGDPTAISKSSNAYVRAVRGGS